MVDPGDYPALLVRLQADAGSLPLALRFELAQKAFAHTADYDRAIADFLA
ncbi:MAG: hypothetical protein U5J82_11735 [Desulfobacterales bacterium]|nr:hypothetical protein [Desulfobacterales bacterium]